MFIVQAHWNNSLRVDMSLHLGTFIWLWANPSLFFLLNAKCFSREAPNTNLYSLWFYPTGLHPTIYRNQDENTNHYTTDAGQKSILI
jgi:hypothetical protein